jgi:lipopolysaccharide export system protein LptA
MVSIAEAANLTVESNNQHFKDSDHKIDLKGNVKVKYDDINVVSPTAEVILNGETNKPETVKFIDNAYSYQVDKNKRHEVKARIMEVSLLNKVFKAEERVQSTITENGEPTIIVTANTQEYNNKTNTMKASGSVIINYQDVQAFANSAEVQLDKNNSIKKITLLGNANIQKDNSTFRANKFIHYADTKIITGVGNVYSDVNQPDLKIKVWSDFQEVNQRNNTILASGNTKVEYQDYIATGPKATVYPDKNKKLNKVIFLGRSKITNNSRSIEADKITMTLNPKDFNAEGNVKTVIPNLGSNY